MTTRARATRACCWSTRSTSCSTSTALLARWPKPSALGAGDPHQFRRVPRHRARFLRRDRARPAAARAPTRRRRSRRCCRPMPRSTIRSTSPPSASRSPRSSAKTAQAMLDDPAVGALIARLHPRLGAASDGARALAPAGDRGVGQAGGVRAVRRRDAALARISRAPCARPACRCSARPTVRCARWRAWPPMAASSRASAARRPRDAKSAPLPGRGNVPEYRAKACLAALGIAAPEGALAARRGRGANDRGSASAIPSCSRRSRRICRTRATRAA